MANIPFIAAVGAPSSLSVELARKHNMTLVGFLKNYSYNVYSGSQRLIEEQGCQRTSVNCLAEKA